ncbi:hypothetical protein EBZ39_02485 [bacterium]|nr:hypothetical protein [bacterium]
MTTEELQRRVNESPALSALRDKLTDELVAQGNNSYQFDPITIIMIISIIVQVIIHCREKNSADAIQNSMRELRTLPPRKLMRLRRRLNNVWRDHCEKTGVEYTRDNPVVGAVYTLSDTIDDAAAAGLMELAAAQ